MKIEASKHLFCLCTPGAQERKALTYPMIMHSPINLIHGDNMEAFLNGYSINFNHFIINL